MMDKAQLILLAEKYLAGTASEEEKQLLHKWYDAADEEELEIVFAGKNESGDDVSNRIFSKLQMAIRSEAMEEGAETPNGDPARRRLQPYIKWIAAASIVVIALAGGVYWLSQRSTKKQPTAGTITPTETPKDVLPGGNKAILQLADGTVITLDSARNGILGQQGNASIKKQDGQLIYDVSHATDTDPSSLTYNTISTPRGGQYQVILPDGSKVWLNASSSLRFPTVFKGNERNVTLTGEAYFEVATLTHHAAGEKGKKVPFKVTIPPQPGKPAGAEVEVLGTRFNIMAYEDENAINTTLLEGSVKVSRGGTGSIIQPGQQASVTNHSAAIKITEADVEQAIAWKNGLFYFDNMDIQTIMRQIARWYDVEISYAENIPSRYFAGEVSRNVNASVALKILEVGGVHFKLEGNSPEGQANKIIVLP